MLQVRHFGFRMSKSQWLPYICPSIWSVLLLLQWYCRYFCISENINLSHFHQVLNFSSKSLSSQLLLQFRELVCYLKYMLSFSSNVLGILREIIFNLFLLRSNIWKAFSFQGTCDDDMIGTEAIAEFLINSEETKMVSSVLYSILKRLFLKLWDRVQTCDLNSW